MMTLDEAIIHCAEKTNCTNCGLEHKQLGSWLKTLKQKRWIPVEEQLPELHVDVLVSFVDFEEETSTFIDCLVDNNGRLTWSTYNGATDRVLAWMPLPEPYNPQN